MPSRPKKPAHERNTANHSHSLGLAAPGRRIPRHKTSLPDINSQSIASSSATNGLPVSQSPNASTPAHSGIDCVPISRASPVNGTSGDAATMGSTQSHPLPCRRRTVSGPADNDIEANGADSPLYRGPAMSLSLDINNTGTDKPVRTSKSSLAMATTILSACPLWDVIAILIILLHLPPAFITIVNGLFAFMTFVPPSATLSFGNLPTIHDLVAVDPAGAPSIQTMVFVDALLMLCFVWLAVPAQNILLDLAQAVIAIALGGAAASYGQTTRSVICCLSIISASHVLHWRAVRNFGFNLVASSMKWPVSPTSSDSDISSLPSRLHTFPGKARSILGAHILAQGILKGVRRYISWTKSQSELQLSSKKSDHEVIGGSTVSTPRTASTPFEANSETGTVNNGDGRPPGPSPAGGGKEKSAGGKKKNKKQATQVRFQQPFWAALASTKVKVAQDFEQSQAALDAQDAQAAGMNNMGAINFASSTNRVWIMEIGATDICFGVSLLLNQSDGEDEDAMRDLELRKWYVKVNGASWHSIRSKMVERKRFGEDVVERWEAKVYGLTPLSSYHCEVVTESEHEVIYDTSLITQPAPSTETAAVIAAPAQTLQPSSPSTTLRNSIKAAEQESENVKANLKAARKQHKTTHEKLQSQIDREKSKLSNTGGNDERQRQRAKQLENSIVKIKSDHESFGQTLEDLGDIPRSAKQAYTAAKEEARSHQKRLENQKTTYDKSKKESDKCVASAKAELDAALHKRTRFEARQKEYAVKLAEAAKKTEQATQAKAARIRGKLESAASRRQHVLQWENLIAESERTMADDQTSYATMRQELKTLEDWANMNAQGASVPSTPENAALLPAMSSALNSTGFGSSSLPGTRPSSLHVSASGFSPSFVFPPTSGTANQPPISSSFGGLKANRRRASSLEASAISENQAPGKTSFLYNSPFSTSGLAPPPGFGSFSPASSAALLANSTALAPPPHPSSAFPSLSNGFGFGSKPTPAPVGAEKEGRRKGSGGSGHSMRGGAGSENGSPLNGIVGNGLRNGMVSPPSSAIWEAEVHR